MSSPPTTTGTNPPINTAALSQPLQNTNLDDLLTQPNSNDDNPTATEKLLEKWDPTIEAIRTATRAAFPSSPQGPPGTTREEFRSYWHGIFTQLLSTVGADASIPYYLTSPPVKKFEIKVFDKTHALGCPCCLPEVDADIVLENEDGVSKLDLVQGVRDHLYGEYGVVPLVNTEEDEEGVMEMETALVYSANWMSAPSWEGEEGERVCYYREVPEVFLYCCSAGGFKEMMEKEVGGEKEDEKPKGKPKTRRA
ncbi:hypothetical protein C8A03DRAFT_15449 [Achaetomium macrosporum]|uniref:Uncharacterized protein n=1 Tax=Achaetomium macrosporum TaxID=79813 RepID=A0AAN7CAN9_9PEZI|nr:hypothetical protein C8A03DRAFT_15449 [Achaetomium macrosporum]